MQPLARALPRLPIPGYEPERTRSRFVVWSGSTTDEVRFVPVSKKNARAWYQKARNWDRRSKAKGTHGGGIGLPAMAVLHAFHFDFLNYVTGRLDPSYEGIARMTGLARSTVAAAIARLKRFGIINWVRRCAQAYENGVFMLRQETNAYAVLPPSQWCGFVDQDEAPPLARSLGRDPAPARSADAGDGGRQHRRVAGSAGRPARRRPRRQTRPGAGAPGPEPRRAAGVNIMFYPESRCRFETYSTL
jgi:hypothetical protein